MAKEIFITEQDVKRLRDLIQNARDFRQEDEKHLKDLENELDRACIVEPGAVPDNVITMNSRAVLRDMDTGEASEYHLVFPRDADPDQNRISILTPVGTALLGYHTGDVIEWPVPAGVVRFKIEQIVYQPEAAGHFHL